MKALLTVIVLAATPALAQEPPARHLGGQRNIGVAAELGFQSGLGAGVHLGTGAVEIYATGGVSPVLVSGNDRATNDVDVRLYGAGVVDASVAAYFLPATERTDLGLLGGYSFNTRLGHGFTLGGLARIDLARRVALTVVIGVAIYPNAEDELAEHDYPIDEIDPRIPWLQGGANVGLVFYP